MLTLVEKAESAIKEEDAEAMTKQLLSAKFDFNDFLKQSKMMSSMGSMGSIMKMLPGQYSIFFRQCPTLQIPQIHARPCIWMISASCKVWQSLYYDFHQLP